MQDWVEFPLSNGRAALVDVADLLVLARHKWCAAAPSGAVWYAQRSGGTGTKPSTVRMHRWLMQPPDGMVVDHINGNGLDNRRSNLRICAQQQNSSNCRRRRAGVKSPYVGVSSGRNGRWRATIKVNGQKIHLGVFDDAKDAARAYDAAALAVFDGFAAPNFADATPMPLCEQIRKTGGTP